MTFFEEIPSTASNAATTTISAALKSKYWENILLSLIRTELDDLSFHEDPEIDSEGLLKGSDGEVIKLFSRDCVSSNDKPRQLVMRMVLPHETWKFSSAFACRKFLQQLETTYGPEYRILIEHVHLELNLFDEEECRACHELLRDMATKGPGDLPCSRDSILPRLASLSVCFVSIQTPDSPWSWAEAQDLYADTRRFEDGPFSREFFMIAFALAKIQVDDATIEGLKDYEIEKQLRRCMMLGDRLYLSFKT